jgi:hypothetical protein
MVRIRVPAAAACVAASLLVACSKGSEGPAGPTTPNYVGAWEGTTSQGKPVQFWLESDGAHLVTFADSIRGTVCTSRGTYYFVADAPDTAIALVGSAFSMVRSGSAGVISMSGTFGATSASGSLLRTSISCNGADTVTWTAAKVTAPFGSVTGTWNGTFSSSVVSSTTGTFVLAQSGAAVSGTWSFANGGVGTISGTVAGNMGKVSIVETTVGCAGTFSGHASLHTNPAGLYIGWAGSDCLGSHHHAGGFATPAP